MAVLGGVGAVGTPVLVHVRVGLHVAVQHGLVHTAVVAVLTLERLCA